MDKTAIQELIKQPGLKDIGFAMPPPPVIERANQHYRSQTRPCCRMDCASSCAWRLQQSVR